MKAIVKDERLYITVKEVRKKEVTLALEMKYSMFNENFEDVDGIKVTMKTNDVLTVKLPTSLIEFNRMKRSGRSILIEELTDDMLDKATK